MASGRRISLACLLVLVGSLLALPTEPASACSCPPALPASEALERSGAVFLGTVGRIEKDFGPDPTNNVRVTFDVLRTAKGAVEDTIVVRTSSQSNACGYTFNLSEIYLVYADVWQGALSTTLCSRTSSPSYAGYGDFWGDLAAFGIADAESRTITLVSFITTTSVVATLTTTETMTAFTTTTATRAAADEAAAVGNLALALPIAGALFVIGALILKGGAPFRRGGSSRQ